MTTIYQNQIIRKKAKESKKENEPSIRISTNSKYRQVTPKKLYLKSQHKIHSRKNSSSPINDAVSTQNKLPYSYTNNIIGQSDKLEYFNQKKFLENVLF